MFSENGWEPHKKLLSGIFVGAKVPFVDIYICPHVSAIACFHLRKHFVCVCVHLNFLLSVLPWHQAMMHNYTIVWGLDPGAVAGQGQESQCHTPEEDIEAC